MSRGWSHITPSEPDHREDKPGQRWELSSTLGVDAFNLNVAILEPGERLSQNQFHYHENQQELVYVASGRCRVEVQDGRFVADPDDVVRFDAGPNGVHLIHNPFEEPVRLVAIGWPPEGRHPVRQVATADEIRAERDE